MRIKNKYKSIKVEQAIYDYIQEDKIHFQKVIGGGKWSISDTLREWKKILDMK